MKILLALDGSRHSLSAEARLAKFPFAAPPDVILATACPVPDLHFLGRGVTPDVNTLVDECRGKAQQLLDDAETRCRSWAGSLESRLLDGHPGKELVSIAEQENIDLVAVGARGIGATQRFFLGSVSDKVAKYAPCSVFVAHDVDESSPAAFQHILIADDGSPVMEDAVGQFAGLPLGAERKVTILGVVEVLTAYGAESAFEADDKWEKREQDLQGEMSRSAAAFKSATPNVETLVKRGGSAADMIIETATSLSADLIVLGSTGKSGWERLLLGSVSNRVLHHAPTSIWIHRRRSN